MRMRTIIMIAHTIVTMVAPICLSAAQDVRHENVITESALKEFHDFTTADDKTVKARVRAYYPDQGIVAITKENGSSLKVDLGIFSTADQVYVREWDLIKTFFTQNRFHVSVRKKQNKTGAEHMIWRMEEEIVYAILLENRSDYDLKGLTVDYCIYFEPDRLGYREQIEIQNVKCGTLKIGTLAAGEKMQVETRPVVCPKKGGGLEYYKENQAIRGKARGLWIQIYLPLAGGTKAIREFSSPSSLIKNCQWTPPDATASQNNRQEIQR